MSIRNFRIKQPAFIVLVVLVLFGSCKSTKSNGTGSNFAQLSGYNWLLVELNGQQPPSSGNGRPELQFNVDRQGRVTGFTGCNRLSGTFSVSNDTISFGALITTRMACADNHSEQPFLDALKKAVRYTISDSTLSLTNAGNVVARFKGEVLAKEQR